MSSDAKYKKYADSVPEGKLDLTLDEENEGVDRHLHQLADEIPDWDIKLAPLLGLTRNQVKDIRKQYRDEPARQRIAALQLWKEKEGVDATYGNLLRTCLDSGHGGCAAKIVHLLQASPSTKRSKVDEVPQAFTAYKKELQASYNSLQEPDDELDIELGIARYTEFIDLALVNKDKEVDKTDSFLKSTLRGGVDDIVATKTPIEMDHVLAPDSCSKFVLVEGRAGIGKTTFCGEFCRKWDGLKCLRDYKIVLHIKLRDKYVQKATSLHDLFEIYNNSDDPGLCCRVEEEVLKCKGEGVLFVLDGLDEMPVLDKNSLIMAIISAKRGKPGLSNAKPYLPKAARLVTSRPSALHNKKYFPKESRHVEILGFTDDCKERYAENAFKSDDELLKHFKKFIRSNPVINALMHIPLNCAIAVQVYKDFCEENEQMPKTMTQLYKTLIPALIRRDMIRKGKWDEDTPVPSFENLLEEVPGLKRVCELAFEGLFKEDIQLEFTLSVNDDVQCLGLLKKAVKKSVLKGLVPSYSFLHLSIQEFLAAWHVSCNEELVDGATSAMFESQRKTMVHAHFHNFGLFLAGMIGCKHFLLRCEELYLWYCLYEAQEPDLELRNRDRSHIYLTTPMDMYVVGYALVHYPFQQGLSIESSCDPLVSSLADHAHSSDQILGSIHALSLDGDYLLSIPPMLFHVLQSLQDLYIFTGTSSLSELLPSLPALPNLRNLVLRVRESYPDDHLLYQTLGSLSHLEKLDLHFTHMTSKGLQELTKSISNHSALESIEFKYGITSESLPSARLTALKLELHQLIVAALSCSNLKSLEIRGFPFRVSKSDIPSTLKGVELTVYLGDFARHNILEVRLFDCLCSTAEMCAMPSVIADININYGIYSGQTVQIPAQQLCNFLAVLNESLYCNQSMWRLSWNCFAPLDPCDFKHLSHALRRDPVISQHNLRRSKSLCDLTTVQKVRVDWNRETFTDHHHSCPDLLEIQSLLQKTHTKLWPTLPRIAEWLSPDIRPLL